MVVKAFPKALPVPGTIDDGMWRCRPSQYAPNLWLVYRNVDDGLRITQWYAMDEKKPKNIRMFDDAEWAQAHCDMLNKEG